MNEHTFLLIGCGNISQRHITYIQRVGKLIAVCDVNEDKAKALATKNGVKYYTDYQQMYWENQGTTVAVICTPNGLHAQHTIDGLNAGFHILCEKPMAIKSIDVALMLAAAEKNKKHLFIVKQNRFNPPVQAVKKILVEEKLGKIYSLQLTCVWNRPVSYYTDSSWKGTKQLDGGTLFTQFSHFIDILYWFFGEIKIASAITKNAAHGNSIEFEDEGSALLILGDGIVGTIHYSVNGWQKNIEGSLLIVGEKGTIKIGGEYLNKLEYQNIDGFEIEELPIGNLSNNYGSYQGSMSNHGAVYENLVATLNGNELIATNGYEAGKTVSIIEDIYRKAIHL